MPSRLRPTASLAAEAILVGDPGRALLLAQELLVEPKMSNHARGLWGYSGETAGGGRLTIQSTGMGGPSAVLVLADLAELGVRRAVRVGTCVRLDPGCEPGQLLLVTEASGAGGGSAGLLTPGESAIPDPELTERLRGQLGEGARTVAVASFDSLPVDVAQASSAAAADMQTASLLAKARSLAIAAAAVLIVAEGPAGEGLLEDEALRESEKRGGRAAVAALSP